MLYAKKRWEPKVTKRKRTWQQVLLQAADYIQEHGWVRNRQWGREGQVCMVGAITQVTINSPGLRQEVVTQLTRYFERSIVHMNDEVARSKRDVIRWMRAAAKRS